MAVIRTPIVKNNGLKSKKTVGEVVGKTVGKTTRMHIHAWWGYILYNNHSSMLTDEELSVEFYKEFPLRTYHQPVKRFRGWYNHGTYNSVGTSPHGKPLMDGIIPEILSVEYQITETDE